MLAVGAGGGGGGGAGGEETIFLWHPEMTRIAAKITAVERCLNRLTFTFESPLLFLPVGIGQIVVQFAKSQPRTLASHALL
jgi:hypothetical protein